MDKALLQQRFVDFLLNENALLFGDYTLKSGRVSPYFLNLRILSSGRQLYELGVFYAEAIYQTWNTDFDIIFGPAYAGISVAVSTAIAFHRQYKLEKHYLTHRKEVKGYADKSVFLGASLQEGARIILVDDVITTGMTKIESARLLRSQFRVNIKGLVIGLDRLEKGEKGKGAVEEFTNETGIPVVSIATLNDVISYLSDSSDAKKRLEAYLRQYGIVV